MKTTSRTLKVIVLSSLSVLVGLFVIVPSFALEPTTGGGNTPGGNTPKTTEVKKDKPTSVCSRIATFSTSGKEAVSNKRSMLQTDFSNRLANVSTRQTEVDKKLSDARTAGATKFDNIIKSLQAETGLSTDQLAAIDTYKSAVQAAEAVRVSAVDDARSAYRTALATLIATQQQKLSTAVTNYQATLTVAFGVAIANCTDTNASVTLATLKASIKSARDLLSGARTPDASHAAIKQLATTRDTAIKTASEAFTNTIKPLTLTLRAALKVATTTTTN